MARAIIRTVSQIRCRGSALPCAPASFELGRQSRDEPPQSGIHRICWATGVKKPKGYLRPSTARRCLVACRADDSARGLRIQATLKPVPTNGSSGVRKGGSASVLRRLPSSATWTFRATCRKRDGAPSNPALLHHYTLRRRPYRSFTTGPLSSLLAGRVTPK
jgi:hypothetical protein